MAVLYTNNATTTLSAAITDVQTTLTVAAATGALFPNPSSPDYFMATLVDASNNIEIVKVTGRSTDTFTIVRAQEGTTAKVFSSGDKVELRVTAGGLENKLDKDTGGTLSGKLTTVASAAANAGLSVPHGAAPTTPSNGDMWTTTAGLYVRVNGATVGPLAAAGSFSVDDTAYGAGWNGDTTAAPSKNAVYDQMELRAPKASPALTGTPTAPTASGGTTTTQIATTAFVRTPNVQSVTSSATVTPTFSNDAVKITAQAAGLTLANPTGTAIDMHGIVIRIKDNGTARAISYGAQYRAIGVTLPTTTVVGKTIYLAMIYNNNDTKWDVVAVAQEA